jgi:hypothetical protein
MFRIQVFHCIHHDGEGGNTLLVDGFNCAEKLRASNPAAYDTLTSTIVPHEYIEGKSYHLYCQAPVLKVDPLTSRLVQFR